MEYLRLAEVAGEGNVLGVADVLAGKHHDQMPGPGVVDRLQGLGIDRPAEIDAADFRTESGVARLDGDGHGCRW